MWPVEVIAQHALLIAIAAMGLGAASAGVAMMVTAIWHLAGFLRRAPRRGADIYAEPFGDFPLIDGPLCPRRGTTFYHSDGTTNPSDAAATAVADAGGDGVSHPLGQTPPASIPPSAIVASAPRNDDGRRP